MPSNVTSSLIRLIILASQEILPNCNSLSGSIIIGGHHGSVILHFFQTAGEFQQVFEKEFFMPNGFPESECL